MNNDTTHARHPKPSDGSMRELSMREVDRQWNQWVSAPISVRHRNRIRRGGMHRILSFRIRSASERRGRGGHISGATAMRMVRYAEIERRERDAAYDRWMQMLEDEEIAQDIRGQAMAGEGAQLSNEWDRVAA